MHAPTMAAEEGRREEMMAGECDGDAGDDREEASSRAIARVVEAKK